MELGYNISKKCNVNYISVAKEGNFFPINIGHLHKERAAVLTGIDNNFTQASANEGSIAVRNAEWVEGLQIVGKQLNKPVKH